MSKINELESRKAKLLADATATLQRGLKTAEQRQSYDALLKQIDGIQEELDVNARLERARVATGLAPSPSITISESSEQRKAQVNAAFRDYFRSGHLRPEHRALLTVTDSAGGGLVAQSFDSAFTEASKFNGPIFDLVHRKDQSNGEQTKFVTVDPTTQTMSLLSQGSTSTSVLSQQPTVFSTVKALDTLVGSTVYSVQELEDAFDLKSFLARTAGLAVARAREVAVTVGTTNDGTSTALPNAPSGGLLGSISAGATQSAGTLAAGVTYAQLAALAASVDRSYYATGAFMASPSVEAALRAQTDSTGRPLYAIDPQTGLLIIAGRPLYPNTAMPANGTASAKLVTFGDYSRAWNVVSTSVSIRVIGNDDGNPSLPFLTRQLLVSTEIGQSAGVSNAVKALVSAAS